MYSIVMFQPREIVGTTKSLTAAKFLALRASRVDSEVEYAVEGAEFASHDCPVFRDGQQIQGSVS